MLVWDWKDVGWGLAVEIGRCWFGIGRMWGGDTDTSPFLSFAPYSLVIHLVRNLKKRKKGERNE